jgi:hypothetical protein
MNIILFERKKMKAIKTLAEKVLEKVGLVSDKNKPVLPSEEGIIPDLIVDPINEHFIKQKTLRYLKDDLYNVVVNFTKKDGSKRAMICTQAENLIPENKRPKKQSEVDENSSVCKVFDLEKQAWRSFTWESFHSMQAKDSTIQFDNSTTVESEQNATI